MIINYKKIRRDNFSTDLPYNYELKELINNYPTHNFLRNKTSQNIYNYLVKYVIDFSQQYFGKRIGDINVLDWGCGKGQVTYLMIQNGASVISCDIQQNRSDSSFGQDVPIIKKSNIKVDPLLHPFLHPYNDGQFDVVLSFGVLEHVPNDNDSMSELNRILKTDGLLFVFNLPYYLSWTQYIAHIRGDNYHDRLYSKKRIFSLTKDYGFQIMDYWFRQLLPKNTINYPNFRLFEKFDQFVTEYTFLKYFSTSIEFVARKK